jgi:transcriptional regulator with XRE-family HTH domain
MIDLYKKVKTLREEKEISQEEISKKIGISRTSYIKFEKGEKELTLSELQKLADILDFHIGDFLDNEKNVEKYKQMLFFILRNMGDKKIVKTKLAKMLYLADFAWYYNTYESMSGMKYRKMTHGPVPNDFFSVLGELEERGLVKKSYGNLAEFYEESEAGKNVKENLLSSEEKKLIKKIVKK